MSLVIISMMTIVALGIVFADDKDKEGCPCNPQPPANVTKENTEGNVQPLGECMRYHIEYRNCGPKEYVHTYMRGCHCYPQGACYYQCCREWEQQCEKWGVWYDICLHQTISETYYGTVTRTGKDCESYIGICCCCP